MHEEGHIIEEATNSVGFSTGYTEDDVIAHHLLNLYKSGALKTRPKLQEAYDNYVSLGKIKHYPNVPIVDQTLKTIDAMSPVYVPQNKEQMEESRRYKDNVRLVADVASGIGVGGAISGAINATFGSLKAIKSPTLLRTLLATVEAASQWGSTKVLEEAGIAQEGSAEFAGGIGGLSRFVRPALSLSGRLVPGSQLARAEMETAKVAGLRPSIPSVNPAEELYKSNRAAFDDKVKVYEDFVRKKAPKKLKASAEDIYKGRSAKEIYDELDTQNPVIPIAPLWRMAKELGIEDDLLDEVLTSTGRRFARTPEGELALEDISEITKSVKEIGKVTIKIPTDLGSLTKSLKETMERKAGDILESKEKLQKTVGIDPETLRKTTEVTGTVTKAKKTPSPEEIDDVIRETSIPWVQLHALSSKIGSKVTKSRYAPGTFQGEKAKEHGRMSQMYSAYQQTLDEFADSGLGNQQFVNNVRAAANAYKQQSAQAYVRGVIDDAMEFKVDPTGEFIEAVSLKKVGKGITRAPELERRLGAETLAGFRASVEEVSKEAAALRPGKPPLPPTKIQLKSAADIFDDALLQQRKYVRNVHYTLAQDMLKKFEKSDFPQRFPDDWKNIRPTLVDMAESEAVPRTSSNLSDQFHRTLSSVMFGYGFYELGVPLMAAFPLGIVTTHVVARAAMSSAGRKLLQTVWKSAPATDRIPILINAMYGAAKIDDQYSQIEDLVEGKRAVIKPEAGLGLQLELPPPTGGLPQGMTLQQMINQSRQLGILDELATSSRR